MQHKVGLHGDHDVERTNAQSGKRKSTSGTYRRTRQSCAERLRRRQVREGGTGRENRGRGASPRLRGKRCRAAMANRDGGGVGMESCRARGKAETNPLVGRVATSWCEKWCGSGPAIQGETGLAVRVVGPRWPPKNVSSTRWEVKSRERRRSGFAEGIACDLKERERREASARRNMVPDSAPSVNVSGDV